MYNFRVLNISNNLKEYPQCKKDTLEFPDLIDDAEDEMEIFIYCIETEEYWPAEEFFNMVNCKKFLVDEKDIKFE